ncbi:MAG: MraY family glycosyltransferase [Pseudomonadota bacterium]
MNLLFTLSSIVITAVLFHLLLIRFAQPLGLIDTPNERSMHKNAIPRGAGIAIFMSVLMVQALFNWDHLNTYFLVYLAITIVFIIGVIDDIFDSSPRQKLLFIFIAGTLLYWNGNYIGSLGNYFGYDLTLPLLIAFPFTLFAIAGFTNALNLIDGLDGLAASESLIILGTFFAIGIIHNDTLIITLSSSFIASLLVFLFFNWNPARIFMGDSGSLTLGFVIATLCIVSLKYVSPASILFITAIPLLDTFLVIIRRIQRGMSPFKADKNHIHHFMYNIKGDVRVSVIIIASIQAMFSIIGFQMRTADGFLSLILFSLLFFIFLNMFDQRIRYRKTSKNKKRLRDERAQKIEEKNTLSDLANTSIGTSILIQQELK